MTADHSSPGASLQRAGRTLATFREFRAPRRRGRCRRMTNRRKIALIGAGNIGGELAALVARKQLGDVVLFDIPQKSDYAKGKALDLEQNSAVLGYDASIKGTSDWAD